MGGFRLNRQHVGRRKPHPAAPKKLTETAVRKMLKARGLKATATELTELTRMMNADLEREAAEKEAEAARERNSLAFDKFMADLLRPVRAEQQAAARSGAKARKRNR